MPKEVMESLQLNNTKPFHDLYVFDSRAVKCIKVIKDLVSILSQIPKKCIIMDVVVANIPPKHVMLLPSSCTMKIGGTLQMNYLYAIVLLFGGEIR